LVARPLKLTIAEPKRYDAVKELMGAFWIGVASSLAAWLAGLWITYEGIPMLQGLLWKVTDISGPWLAFHQDPAASGPVGNATIRQRGPRITMTLHRNLDSTNQPTDRNYRYRGTFRGRQLTLVWEAIDRPDSRVGAMVLHLSEDAQVFKGKTVFYSDNVHGAAEVDALPYWLKRPPR
jgi:hypothetical protein